MSKTTVIVIPIVLYLLWSRSRVMAAASSGTTTSSAGNTSGYVNTISLPIASILPIGPGNSGTFTASPIVDYGAN